MTTSLQQKKELLPTFCKTSRQQRNEEATISKAIQKEKVRAETLLVIGKTEVPKEQSSRLWEMQAPFGAR
jgi:hypothetical protein